MSRGPRIPRSVGYLIRQTWLRRTLLAAVVTGLVVAPAAAWEVSGALPTLPRGYMAMAEYLGGEYLLQFHAYDGYGGSLAGVEFQITVYNTTGGGGPPYPILAEATGATNGNGNLKLELPLPRGVYRASFLAGPQGLNPPFWSGSPPNGTFQLEAWTVGALVPILDGPVQPIMPQTGFSGAVGLLIYYPYAPNACPSGCPVFYTLFNSSRTPSPTPLPPSAMRPFGRMTSSSQFFSLSPPLNTTSQYYNVQVEVFSSAGQLLLLDSSVPTNQLILYVTESVSYGAFLPSAILMTLLFPLLAVAAAYSTYAGDRLTGVLESTIAQPVTRGWLASSRFLATTAALCAMLAAWLALSDLLGEWLVGYYLLPVVVVAYFLAGVVAVGFTIGLLYLVPHLSRSMTVFMTVAIGTYLLLIGLWPSVLMRYGSGGGDPTPPLAYLNPLYFFGATILSALTPPSPGLSYGVLALAGTAWAIGPFLLLQLRIRLSD